MKKRFIAVMISFITVLELSGCYPTEKRINKNTSENVSNLDNVSNGEDFNNTHFKFSKENLEADFDYPDVPNELPSKIKLREKMFVHEDMIKLFFGGKEPVWKDIYGAENEWGDYRADDGAELTIGGNSLKYSSGKTIDMDIMNGLKAPVNYFGLVSLCKDFERDQYSIGSEELDDFPLREALDSVRELISNVGLDGLGDPEIYTFSLSTYEKLKSSEYYLFNEEYPLTKDDEVYFFVFPWLFDGVELSDIRYVDIKDEVSEYGAPAETASLTVGIAKDGIFSFVINEAFEAGGEIISEEPIKYDFDHALTELKSYFDKVMFTRTEETVINKATVFYLPVEKNEVNTMEFVSAWGFEGYGCDRDVAEELDHVTFWDLRYLVTTDAGVVRKYSEV